MIYALLSQTFRIYLQANKENIQMENPHKCEIEKWSFNEFRPIFATINFFS